MTTIIGIPFFDGELSESVALTLEGGLVVAPSGPGLANDFLKVPIYRQALLEAKVALTDSAIMVALFRFVTDSKVPRHSGLKFLKALLDSPVLREPNAVYWVMPTAEESAPISEWLHTQGLKADEENTYIAPFYPNGAIQDEILLERLKAYKPKVVVLNIAGGKQEILGAWLAKNLTPTPGIVCTGAAVAFLAGTQANIPIWADRLGLGWFFRCLSSPRKFVPRYWHALPLVPLVLRYRDKLPPEPAVG